MFAKLPAKLFAMAATLLLLSGNAAKAADANLVYLIDVGSKVSTKGADGSGKMNPWIAENFRGVPVTTGNFTSRITLESPVLVKDSTACCGKYGFQFKCRKSKKNRRLKRQCPSAPVDKRAAFVNVTIRDLQSSDAYGGAISTTRTYPNMMLYLSNVYIDPNWPTWISYSKTNKDGLVLDSADEIFAEDVTIKRWSDAAIDNKALRSQFVRLNASGAGNHTIRYWRVGPHYLVDSSLTNPGGHGEGTLMWFKTCAGAVVNIFNSKFNGSATVPANKIKCKDGGTPKLNYLKKDPRTTGEMHPMFTGR